MTTLAQLAAAFAVLVLDWITGASRTEPARYGPLVRFVTKHPLVTAAGLGGTLAFGAAIVVVSGVMPIRASSGHWPVTAWLLDFAKVQSVKTYSLGIDAPPLDDEALILRGAAHYAVGCESCHGGPNAAVPPVMAAMTPPPPLLTAEHVTRWTAAQLFSIVKHGIKFTGMPAWPAQQRDDEVWAVVAFVARLPQTDGDEYQSLVGRTAAGDPSSMLVATTGREEPLDAVRAVCSRCHGIDGTGREGAFPSIAGQRADYLHSALRAFADRTRFSATMADMAARLDETAMREISTYFAQLPARSPSTSGSDAAARGAIIAAGGIPGRDVPACVECHGPSVAPKNPAFPRLAGQHARYLVQQLELLKQRRRGGSPRVNLMHVFVDRLETREMQDVAQYYASLRTEDAP